MERQKRGGRDAKTKIEEKVLSFQIKSGLHYIFIVLM